MVLYTIPVAWVDSEIPAVTRQLEKKSAGFSQWRTKLHRYGSRFRPRRLLQLGSQQSVEWHRVWAYTSNRSFSHSPYTATSNEQRKRGARSEKVNEHGKTISNIVERTNVCCPDFGLLVVLRFERVSCARKTVACSSWWQRKSCSQDLFALAGTTS